MKKTILLAIESSCDDTSAAVICDGVLLSNTTASQAVHEEFGGVVPELASRAHQLNIVPVVDAALKRANVTTAELSAIAFTRGPGLLGSLLVGTSFAKGLALAHNIPLVEVNHLQAHILAHFIQTPPSPNSPITSSPTFPFLCLLVSGGNSQIVLVKSYCEMEIVGQTIDDAAGEAFDKCAKVMGLPYPGGPWIDRLAKEDIPLTLSVSLHAPNNSIRSQTMPVNKTYPVEALIEACRRYAKQTGRRISFEYAMIDGVNDSAECATTLARLLSGMLCHVNLIPVNPIKEREYVQSNAKVIEAFKNKLEKAGINATVRREMGRDIDGACGQLRKRYKDSNGNL